MVKTYRARRPVKYMALAMSMMLLGFLLSCRPAAEPLVPYRAWEFHHMNTAYVVDAMQRAAEYDVNTVVFSHGMIGEVSQLFDGTDRGEQLRQLAKKAHGLRLKAWIWVHELDNVPDRFLIGEQVQMDKEGFWEWLRDRYEEVFTEYPEFDGVMLTFHETEYKIFNDKEVQSSLSKAERFTRLINTIDDACAKYQKDFIVRAFFYEPQQMQWFGEGLKNVHSRVILQAKCMPHDWDPFYPHNPMIGKFPDRQLIVEFSPSTAFLGGEMPFASPEYYEYRWRYDLSQPGVVGYNARVEHIVDALHNPEEINLYTLYRMSEDKDITAEDIWEEWTRKRYGENGAELVEKALKLTAEMVKKTQYFLGFWVTDSNIIPGFFYASGHISLRSLAKWEPDNPVYQQLEHDLNHPDPVILEKILAEKDEAMALAHKSLAYLREAKPYLTDEKYNHLVWKLNIAQRTIVIWKIFGEAFFGYKVLAEGHEVPGLRERVERAVDALYQQADVSEIDPTPQPAGYIRRAADEINTLLKMPPAAHTTMMRELRQEVGNLMYLFGGGTYLRTVSTNGETIYEMRGRSENDRDLTLRIAQDGRLLQKTANRFMDELPETVRATIKKSLGDAFIKQIMKVFTPEKVVYEVKARSENKSLEITVDSKGELLR